MTLYKGRINGATNRLMDAINKSLPVDIRLLPYDVETNRAWCRQLAALGILTEKEFDQIDQALDEILDEAEAGAFFPLPDDEDVHTLVERLLTEKVGDAGAKVHTGRSRNDQVVCDLRMYTVDKLSEIGDDIVELITVLKDLAKKHQGTLLAGTTHLQPAQPITLGHFLLSPAFALLRDMDRLSAAVSGANYCPLGSGALAGAGFGVDRIALAEELGFDGACENSIDAVSDRDFVQEAACALAICLGHLSRYAEQFIIWANPAFGYIRFSDTWSTGSSMMPQKRNPDPMELIRGKTARCIGNATSLLALTKGLPLAYAKDLQEDKEQLFDSMDTAGLCIQVFTQALASATFDPEKMKQALTGDMLATEIADALVKTGMPFRIAHEKVAQFVTTLEKQGSAIDSLTPADLTEHFPELANAKLALTFQAAVARRTVLGGTSSESVTEQIASLDSFIEGLKHQ